MSIESRHHSAEIETNKEQAPDFLSIMSNIESNIERALENADNKEVSEDALSSHEIERLQQSLEEKKAYIQEEGNSYETYNALSISRTTGEPNERAADYAALVALEIDRAERVKNGDENDEDEFYSGVTSVKQIKGGNVTIDTSVMARADKHQTEFIGTALGADLSTKIDSNDSRLTAIWQNTNDHDTRIWGASKQEKSPYENWSTSERASHRQKEKEKAEAEKISFHETSIPNFILRIEGNNVWGHYQFPDRLQELESTKE